MERPADLEQTPWALLVALASVPCLVATLQLGRIHPDETYQFLEPAFQWAYGYGKPAWEWREGLRNWAIPGTLGLLLKGTRALGVEHPVAYRAVLEVPVFALHLWMLHATFRYAKRHAPRRARTALFAVALYGPLLIFAGRTMGESFSAAFVVIALEALDRPPRADRDELRAGAVGGCALGLAVVARYGSLPFVVAALVWLALRGRWYRLVCVIAAGSVVACALSLLDHATWGRPFASLVAYASFNVFSGGAARDFGAQPAWWYAAPFVTWAAAWIWIALPLAVRRERLSIALFAALVYFATLVATPHKEERFLYPGLVVLLLAAIPGIEVLGSRWASLAVVGTSLAHVMIPVDVCGDEIRAIVRATRGPASGLVVVGENEWGTGGTFFIGRNIPWSACDGPADPRFDAAMADVRVNRAVAPRGVEKALSAHGFRRADDVGRFAIFVRAR